MIQIDIDADLNMVDDEDRNVARLPWGAPRFRPGQVAVAGRPGFWSWVRIDEIDHMSITFRRISATEAAESGELALAAPAGREARHQARETDAIRAWARANGLEVPSRGPVAPEAMDQHRAAGR